MNTPTSLDYAFVLAADFAYLFRYQALAAPCFLAGLLKLGRDYLCMRYLHNYVECRPQQDSAWGSTDDACSLVVTDSIWEDLNHPGDEYVERGTESLLPDLNNDYPIFNPRGLGFGYNIIFAILYLRIKEDLISLRAFEVAEGFLERRLNYDVKELVRPLMIESEVVRKDIKRKKLVLSTMSHAKYEDMIQKADKKARCFFLQTEKRVPGIWKKALSSWGDDRSSRLKYCGKDELDAPPIVPDFVYPAYVLEIFDSIWMEVPGFLEWIKEQLADLEADKGVDLG
ncbi:hypothetical protein TWF481_012183 [Arthrobotrys musiformis]|uniref:ELMO domain-containing protein n=1 Tax=Arthrobotrys musiformis TaxID=47236 RepID=A0AAV9VXQ4_9PEZI